MKTAYHGNLVLPDQILYDGYLTVEDGIISYIGEKRPDADQIKEIEGFIAPGFVDIHCHACPTVKGEDDPLAMADCHYGHGTTSLLITIYRGLAHEEYLEIIRKVKEVLPKTKNLRGLHFEGPYINCRYGASKEAVQPYPDKKEYMEYINSGLFRQWTCSPEIEGTMELIRDLKMAGIVPAIGHSEASYPQVMEAVKAGAGIETHIFDATGTTPETPDTICPHHVSFDEACMLADGLYYEFICDRHGIHVRKEMIKLLEKTVGIDRMVAITDCCEQVKEDDMDINYIPETDDISGSKMTMDRVSVNLRNIGYSMPDIAKMTARNPARAIKMYDRGEIAVGMHADLIRVNEGYQFLGHLENR